MAEDARRMADHMHDPESRRVMLEIASNYDRLAIWTANVDATDFRCGGQLGHDAMKLIAECFASQLPSANRDRRARPHSRQSTSQHRNQVDAATQHGNPEAGGTIRPIGQRQPEPRLA